MSEKKSVVCPNCAMNHVVTVREMIYLDTIKKCECFCLNCGETFIMRMINGQIEIEHECQETVPDTVNV